MCRLRLCAIAAVARDAAGRATVTGSSRYHRQTGTSTGTSPGDGGDGGVGTGPGAAEEPAGTQQPRRFYGSVEIDMVRPVKSLDGILNAVVMELQRDPNTKVKITLEIEAGAPSGFSEADVGVVRDNARQLKFKADSTGFE